MRIAWTFKARLQRDEIWAHIASDNIQAAIDLDESISRTMRRVETFPDSGRPGLVHGTREVFPHESYRLIYRVDRDLITVLALVHTARQWPPLPDTNA